jgi:hypothetical protein
MKFTINEKELADWGITQDEIGTYFTNALGNYWVALYPDFMSGKAPSGYVANRSGAGSHASDTYAGKKQWAWDFPQPAWSLLYCDLPVKIIEKYSTYNDPSCYVRGEISEGGDAYQVIFVHCYTDRGLWEIVPSGQWICKTNGISGHLHISAQQNNKEYHIGNIIFAKYIKPQYVVNDHVEITAETKVRSTPSVSGAVLGYAQKGAVAVITKPATNADGYTWYGVEFGDCVGYQISDTMIKTDKEMTTVGGQPYDECQFIKDENARLEAENEQLKASNELLQGQINQIKAIVCPSK